MGYGGNSGIEVDLDTIWLAFIGPGKSYGGVEGPISGIGRAFGRIGRL